MKSYSAAILSCMFFNGPNDVGGTSVRPRRSSLLREQNGKLSNGLVGFGSIYITNFGWKGWVQIQISVGHSVENLNIYRLQHRYSLKVDKMNEL